MNLLAKLTHINVRARTYPFPRDTFDGVPFDDQQHEPSLLTEKWKGTGPKAIQGLIFLANVSGRVNRAMLNPGLLTTSRLPNISGSIRRWKCRALRSKYNSGSNVIVYNSESNLIVCNSESNDCKIA